jgi:hypothetical protein
MKLTALHKTASTVRMLFFKQQAPNGMKKRDLIAKWWIITDHSMADSHPAPESERQRR